MKITDALAAEHTIFLNVFDQIDRVLPSFTTLVEVQNAANIVGGLLQHHAEAETSLAYLALDHTLAHKDRLERLHHDHQEIDERLKKIHAANTCAEARRLLKSALQFSRDHFHAEEQSLFPLLNQTLEADTLAELGQAWQQRVRERARR